MRKSNSFPKFERESSSSSPLRNQYCETILPAAVNQEILRSNIHVSVRLKPPVLEFEKTMSNHRDNSNSKTRLNQSFQINRIPKNSKVE